MLPAKVALCEFLKGPFTFVHAVDAGFKGGGDFDILVDDDGSGYLIIPPRAMGMLCR